MNVLMITAGAGGMLCGSCLRDNTLARELMTRGHRVTLVPLYTPTRTDEQNVSAPKVFFGGISVYLEQRAGLFRRTPAWLDRLWDSPVVLRAATRRVIRTEPRLLGEMTVSMLKGEHGRQRKEVDKLMAFLRAEPAPDVVVLPNSLLIALAGPLKRALGRPVICTLQGEDLFLEGLREPCRSQALALIREQVADVDVFVAVSDYCAAFMGDYLAIPPEKMRVAPIGITLDGYPDAPAPAGDRFTVGYFARVCPEKGLHALAEAYCEMRRHGGLPPCRLEAAGWMSPEHAGYLEGVERRLREAGLGSEFAYRGVLDRAAKIEYLGGLSVMCVPSIYTEPKGMYLLEAMACGTPVVQPRAGAFPEIVGRTGGGVLVEPGNAAELAAALRSLALEPERAREMGRRGMAGVREYYSAARMADRAMEIFAETAGNFARSPSQHRSVKVH